MTPNPLIAHRRSLQLREVELGGLELPYYFGSGCMDEIAEKIEELGADKIFIVTDAEVLRLHGDKLLFALGNRTPVVVLSGQPGESLKSLERLALHIEQVLRDGATRRSLVVSFGGGVPGNLAGVVASLLFRGVRLVHIPTTTVSAMDSVLSLKQAINSPFGKNHIGSYYRPVGIYADVSLFETLPSRELRSGLGEMSKNCLAILPELIEPMKKILASGDFGGVETLLWLLDASIRAKCLVTREDPHEKGAGLALEYGHTVGHAIELLDHRQRGNVAISHGEAVALGMLVAARVSRARGWLSQAKVDTHDDIVAGLGVAPCLPDGVSGDEILRLIKDDNKRGYLPVGPDEAPFVLLRELGVPAVTGTLPLVPVGFAEVAAALEELAVDLDRAGPGRRRLRPRNQLGVRWPEPRADKWCYGVRGLSL
ncbi:2-deoxy-scyllo-inosose synthase [Saccharopolyspora gloriosae]|uniref:2-deoxy-scyllo-inosose synthase n=1 Tax=Saccharopolyspora gloriosae TaxID=455344 RepID=UPI001FB77159|nr:2-deoxy-scyllo-inosose synthase [Saccharopolyspora gloriosae]